MTLPDPSAVHPDGPWLLFYNFPPAAMQNEPVLEAGGMNPSDPGMQGQNQPGMAGAGGRAP